MKRIFLPFLSWIVFGLATTTSSAQVPSFQRVAIPPGEFKLTADQPVVMLQAYCIDGDIFAEPAPSPHYTKILSDPENVSVQMGNNSSISMQQAIDRGMVQVTLLENLTIQIKKKTTQPVSFSIRKNAIFGTQNINKDLHIGTLPVANDLYEYNANQAIIWRQRALQKHGFKKELVDGIAQHDGDALAKLQKSLGLTSVNDYDSRLISLAIDNWESKMKRVRISTYLQIYYPELEEETMPNMIKSFFRFVEDAKLTATDIERDGGLYLVDLIKRFTEIRGNIDGKLANLSVRKEGEQWQVIFDDQLLTVSKVPSALGIKVLKWEPLTLDMIHDIQEKTRSYLSKNLPAGYNLLNLGPVEEGALSAFCNGRNHRIELNEMNNDLQFYEKISQAASSDWKKHSPVIIAGDLFENSQMRYPMVDNIEWVNAQEFTNTIRELTKRPIYFVRDLEPFLKITSENTLLKESFLRFASVNELEYDFGLVDLRSKGAVTQVVYQGKNRATELWEFDKKVDLSISRKAMSDYAAGLLSIDELIEQTRDYTNLLEEIQKKAGVSKLVTVEHDELDAAQLWALHDKSKDVQFYRDEPDLDQSLYNAKAKIQAQITRSCVLVTCPVDKASMERLKKMKIEGIQVIFNDSLQHFRKVIFDSLYSQLSCVTFMKDSEFRFADGSLSYATLNQWLTELDHRKDYIHLVSNSSDSLMLHLAESGKFKRVWRTAYDPLDSLSKVRAISVLPEFFAYFSPAVSFLDSDTFMFMPENRMKLRKILGMNYVLLKDGRIRVQLNKITLEQQKEIEKLYLYDNLIDDAVLPLQKNKSINTALDEIFDSVGRNRIREYKGFKDKRNYMLGIPRLKVCLPPKKNDHKNIHNERFSK